MLACFGGSLFGRGAKIYEEPATMTPADTIRNLRFHIQRQEKREQFLEKKLLLLAKEAKEKLNSGDKKGAVATMKKRKLYQAELDKISNVKMTLETQAMNLESAVHTADAFKVMSAGTNTMAKIRTEMGGVESVDDLMIDIQDEVQMADEVNTAIGQTAIGPTMDDDELMKELEDMGNMELQQQLDAAETGTKNLPAVPTSKPSKSKQDEEDFKKLEAELAL
mmetsp:Transcript_13075/g.19244  ORF Transcript_13075/g.19244 Transcript_13075/m.19244 type:complete len:222 (-) Transcript_13075:231-896(-)